MRDTGPVKHLHIPVPLSEGKIADSDLLGAQGGTTGFYLISMASTSFVFSAVVSAHLSAETA